jgi:hypothetical protein
MLARTRLVARLVDFVVPVVVTVAAFAELFWGPLA